MAVKLFRETGRTSLLDAGEARLAAKQGVNPLWVALGLGLWLSTVANAPLWQAWLAPGSTAPLRGAWFLAGSIFCFTSLVLAVLAWRGPIRWAAAAVFFGTALATHASLVLGEQVSTPLVPQFVRAVIKDPQGLLTLRLGLTLVLLGLLPLLLVLRVHMARVHAGKQLLRIVLVCGLCAVGWFACDQIGGASLQATLQQNPQLAALISPHNWFGVFGVSP